jgi:hypothetical protein
MWPFNFKKRAKKRKEKGYQFGISSISDTGNSKEARAWIRYAIAYDDFGPFKEGMLKAIAEKELG